MGIRNFLNATTLAAALGFGMVGSALGAFTGYTRAVSKEKLSYQQAKVYAVKSAAKCGAGFGACGYFVGFIITVKESTKSDRRKR